MYASSRLRTSPPAPARTRGVALVTVLLVVALATIAAVAMAARQQLDIRRTGNILDGDQAYLYALGAENWAVGVLDQDRRDNQVDRLGDAWATVLPAIPIEGGEITGAIEDLQGRFNLNTLIDQTGRANPVALAMFQRLLLMVDLEPKLALAVVDWLDADIDPQPLDGAEDDAYMRATPPYRTGNGRMSSPAELRLVQGFTAEGYTRLAPLITALPSATQINVNTASTPVLMALGQNISASDAEAVIATRGQEGFKAPAEFTAHPALAGGAIDQQTIGQFIGIQSQYFLLRVQVHVGQGRAQLSSLLERAPNGKIRVIMRSREIN